MFQTNVPDVNTVPALFFTRHLVAVTLVFLFIVVIYISLFVDTLYHLAVAVPHSYVHNICWASSVVYHKDVHNVAGSISFVALASTNIPLGLPALSVSILTLQNAVGLQFFARDSFRLFPATPVPIAGKLTLVLPATSQIFCAVVACANVGAVSLKTQDLVISVIASPSG